jgi:hypothetical protein
LEDSLAQWIPVEADLAEPVVDDATDFAGEDTSSNVVLGKRKTYESSVSLPIYSVNRGILTIRCVD